MRTTFSLRAHYFLPSISFFFLRNEEEVFMGKGSPFFFLVSLQNSDEERTPQFPSFGVLVLGLQKPLSDGLRNR